MTRTAWLAAGATLVALTAPPAGWARQDPARRAATIDDVRWMEGAWIATAEGVTIDERWSPPAGGAMLGVGRTVRDGRMIAFEFLRIVERERGLVYIAQPGGRPPTDFGLTKLAGQDATFENPQHDYPKMIRYRRQGAALVAEVSGEQNGRPASERFEFVRAAN